MVLQHTNASRAYFDCKWIKVQIITTICIYSYKVKKGTKGEDVLPLILTQFRLYHEALIRNIITITPEQDIKTSPLQGCTISSMLSVLIYKPARCRIIKWSQVSCLRKQCNGQVWNQIFRSEVWGVNHLAVSFIHELVQHWWFNFLIFSAVFVWRSYIFDVVSWF